MPLTQSGEKKKVMPRILSVSTVVNRCQVEKTTGQAAQHDKFGGAGVFHTGSEGIPDRR